MISFFPQGVMMSYPAAILIGIFLLFLGAKIQMRRLKRKSLRGWRNVSRRTGVDIKKDN
jgi:hypothetical protein